MCEIERQVWRIGGQWVKFNTPIAEFDRQLTRAGDRVRDAYGPRQTFRIGVPRYVHKDLLDQEIQFTQPRRRQIRFPCPLSDEMSNGSERFGMCQQRQ